MASLTIDPTRPPEKGDLIIITPDRQAIIVEADKLGYAQVEIMDITPPAAHISFRRRGFNFHRHQPTPLALKEKPEDTP